MVLPSLLVVVIYTVESRVEMAIRAVGKVWKRSGEDGDGWEFVDESTKVTVTVEPGAGEDEGVKTTRLVIVNGGLLIRLEGERFGETELESGG